MAGNDHMIYQRNIYILQGSLDFSGKLLILMGWQCQTGWMVVTEDNTCLLYTSWIENPEIDVKKLNLTSDTKVVQDFHGHLLLLFSNTWNINWALEKNKDLQLVEFGRS